MEAPTINFNQFLEKEKLKNNGSNYEDWIRHVRIVLNAGSIAYVLDAPLGAPPAEDATDDEKRVFFRLGSITIPKFNAPSCTA